MPFLTSITIEHYRGFYQAREICPAIPNDVPESGLTVLVGPNNSGKTTVLDALKLVANQERKPIDLEHRHRDNPLVITVRNDQGVQKSITNPDGGAITRFVGTENAFPLISDLKFVPSRRAWSSYAPPTD